MFTATYSPDDNKLRLTASARLDPATYERVKAVGFRWAPKLEQFICPAWNPAAEDVAIELAGEIEDEDSTLIERAEERAERFEGYQERRMDEAERAREAVSAIADNIPLGQPILVGHHSERHARRDAEKIQNGMRKAVNLFRTSQYWKDRAASAIGHAKYKELPAVRARRIKTIEAERRKMERAIQDSEQSLRAWRAITEQPERFKHKDGQPTTLHERARLVANLHSVSKCFTLAEFPRNPPVSQYEGMMSLWSALGDTPEEAIVTAEQAQEIALRVCGSHIPRTQRWIDHYDNRLTYERAMLADAGGTVADQNRPEKGGAVRCWVSSRGCWLYIQKVNKVSVTVLDNWGNGGKNFTRTVTFDKLTRVMSAAEVREAREASRIVDVAHDGNAPHGFLMVEAPERPRVTKEPDPKAPEFQALANQLKAGVQVVSAPQLFPTPPELAERMVELAEIEPEHRVLEPSAGTGSILRAIHPYARKGAEVVAVEVNRQLANLLERGRLADSVVEGDFLDWKPAALDAPFDRIIMNPPFENAADVKHIQHAASMLNSGGVLVALCANGPRQREALQPLADLWEDLPPGSFKESGTGVNVALLVIRA